MAALNKAEKMRPGIISQAAENTPDEQALSLEADARKVWEWLCVRYARHRPTLDTNPSLDLGIDSLEWLNAVLEIERDCGVRLDSGAIARFQTLRELLAALEQPSQLERTWTVEDGLEKPEEVIGRDTSYWLKPLNATELAAARCIHSLNRTLICSYFGMRVDGRRQLPTQFPFVIAPHHVSYLDSFALAAALDFELLRSSYWAAWTGIAFGPVCRVIRRLTHVVPIDPLRGAAVNLAYGSAVLKRGHNLIWFPEGALSHTGELMPLKPGLGVLLTKYRVPVVPVVVQGACEALPAGRKIPRRARLTVTFEKALDPHDLERRGAGDQAAERISNALAGEMARCCHSAVNSPVHNVSATRIE